MNDSGYSGAALPSERFLQGLVAGTRRRWRLFAICIAAGVAVTVILWAVTPLQYTATATILPQETERGGTGLLGALASQSGLDLGTGTDNEKIFGRIVESRTALLPLTERTWNHRDFAQPVTLAEVMGTRTEGAEGSGTERLLALLRRRVVDFERDPSTGFMTLRVTMPGDPQLAADVANALVGVLEDFNDRGRFSRARNQREMIEKRLAEVESDLEVSEAALSSFLGNNRAYASSPALAMEYARLEREVSADGLVWQELKRQLEVARIDELRNTLTVDVLDGAVAPVRPDRQGLVFTILVGFLLGCIAAALVIATQIVLNPRPDRAGG